MIVVKLGGLVLENALRDPSLFLRFKDHQNWVIVHGGGAEINQMADKLGVASEFVGGQRVTSKELMKIVESSLSGALNPQLTRALRKLSIPAAGISAANFELLLCDLENPALGLVGRVVEARVEMLRQLLEQKKIPVVAPIGLLKESAEPCNINADMAASALASALKADELVFYTDRNGILDENGKTRERITLEELKTIREGSSVSGGMLVKSRAVIEFLEKSPRGRVVVANGLNMDTPFTEIVC